MPVSKTTLDDDSCQGRKIAVIIEEATTQPIKTLSPVINLWIKHVIDRDPEV